MLLYPLEVALTQVGVRGPAALTDASPSIECLVAWHDAVVASGARGDDGDHRRRSAAAEMSGGVAGRATDTPISI